MTYSEKLPLIRKLAYKWLNNYHWTINDLINFCLDSMDYSTTEKEYIKGQEKTIPYNKLVRFETCIIREILVILPNSGIEYHIEKIERIEK